MALRDFPQELVDHIIAHLRYDHPSLRACSLVARGWTACSQRQLFHSIAIQREPPSSTLIMLEPFSSRDVTGPLEIFLPLIQLSPHLGSYVRHLSLLEPHSRGRHSSSFPPEFIKLLSKYLLPRLPRVSRLSFRMLGAHPSFNKLLYNMKSFYQGADSVPCPHTIDLDIVEDPSRCWGLLRALNGLNIVNLSFSLVNLGESSRDRARVVRAQLSFPKLECLRLSTPTAIDMSPLLHALSPECPLLHEIDLASRNMRQLSEISSMVFDVPLPSWFKTLGYIASCNSDDDANSYWQVKELVTQRYGSGVPTIAITHLKLMYTEGPSAPVMAVIVDLWATLARLILLHNRTELKTVTVSYFDPATCSDMFSVALNNLDDALSSSSCIKEVYIVDEDGCRITSRNWTLVERIRDAFPSTKGKNLFVF